MRWWLLALALMCALTGMAQLTTVQRPDGTVWKNDKNARGWLETGWTRYEFDSTGKLLREVEFASIAKDTYELRVTDFPTGHAVVTFLKPWFFRMYLLGFWWFVIVFFGTFFGRVFVNSRIYNRENGTDMSPVYAHAGPFVTKNFGHSLACTFTFWWPVRELKPENHRFARLANVMSVTALVLFFGALIGLALSGELH